MDNPLDKPRNPQDGLGDVQDLARDLAYGALSGDWNSQIKVQGSQKWGFPWVERDQPDSDNQRKFYKKWVKSADESPGYATLVSLGYLRVGFTQLQPGGVMLPSITEYYLTEKAFELLQKPAISKSIFISYRRRESSAFALLIEARLRNAGADPDKIFVDKNMAGGEKWEQRILAEIKSCNYFVCLIGPTTLDADSWVLKEIALLKEHNPNCIIIPYCHHGKVIDRSVTDIMGEWNGSAIGKAKDDETALDYEYAVTFILNAMGYRTY